MTWISTLPIDRARCSPTEALGSTDCAANWQRDRERLDRQFDDWGKAIALVSQAGLVETAALMARISGTEAWLAIGEFGSYSASHYRQRERDRELLAIVSSPELRSLSHHKQAALIVKRAAALRPIVQEDLSAPHNQSRRPDDPVDGHLYRLLELEQRRPGSAREDRKRLLESVGAVRKALGKIGAPSRYAGARRGSSP